jgi:predicted ATPase/DNA-binding SARP family transcriptional activator/DNA-binding CsgD family transcriptional regulator
MDPSGSEYVRQSEAVRVWLLGGFRVSVGPRTIIADAWRLRKAAALVKLLALAPRHRLHREVVMDLLWPGMAKKAASNNLRQALHVVRRILDSDTSSTSRYLDSWGEQLILCPYGRLWVDVEAFEETSATARRGQDSTAYRAAIELYTGDLLPAERYEGWAESKREELRQLHLTLLVELGGLYAERGEYGRTVETLQRVLSEEPTSEEAHAGLMRHYAVLGRQQEALAQYERLRETLRELDAEPDAVSRRLREEIAAGVVPSTPSAVYSSPVEQPSGRHNLPTQRTSFVGREREMQEVKRLLAMTSLLTLTGTGGCGKTRLALEVGRDLLGIYPDGMWLVELASLSEGGLLLHVVARSLGVHDQPGRPLLETLLDALRDKQALLILDSCEHLLDAAARLADALLASCPRLRVLATSREPLDMAGALSWLVPSLSAPGTQQSLTVEELGAYESARLFADRVANRHPGFELRAENARAVAQVCARLEGIPLAIELAAARVGVLSTEQISERLGHSPKLLTQGDRTADHRHRTLRAAMDWSYELLSEIEQVLFRRLSVFAGHFTLEAAESVGAGGGIEEEDILELLSMLVDKSLVVAEESWERGARYKLLEPVRQYARELLEGTEEAEAVWRRHALWFLALAEEAELGLRSEHQEVWLERLETEHDNLRAALQWFLKGGKAEPALRLSGALGEFWHMRGYLSEGRRWLEAALEEEEGLATLRIKALVRAARIAWELGDYETTTVLGEECLALSRELGDTASKAEALYVLGLTALVKIELERASAAFKEAAALQRELGDTVGLARTVQGLGIVEIGRRDFVRAQELHEESLALAREAGDDFGIMFALALGALAALGQGKHAQGQALWAEGLDVSRMAGMAHGVVFHLQISAVSAGAQGQPIRLARLWGAAETLSVAIGVTLYPIERRFHGPYIAAARNQLDEETWEAALAEGRAMSAEEAVEYALLAQEPTPPISSISPTPKRVSAAEMPVPLTRREREVANLLERRFTSRHIASELHISEHTVDKHVANILRKLNLHSREQVAVQMAKQRSHPF